MRVHHMPLLRQNENLEYCQRDLKKYVPFPDSSRKSVKIERTVPCSLPLPFPWFLLVLGLPVSCTSPVISFGNHPEFANDKASPHTWSMRQITELRTSWSSREPWCLLESHWWHWRCEGNSVKHLSSPPGGKSWGTETQHYPSAMPWTAFFKMVHFMEHMGLISSSGKCSCEWWSV